MKRSIIIMGLAAAMACGPNTKKTAMTNTGSISEVPFGRLPDGQEVSLYTLTNSHGIEIKITNYGGIITSLKTPDRNGNIEDIVLGYDSLAGYVRQSPLFGAIVGRYANRIAHATFKVDGRTYPLLANNGTNSIHGGKKGFDKVVWKAEPTETPQGPSLKLTYLSKDLEEGFPGNLETSVVYSLTNNDELKIDYRGTTDKPTIVNLTNHSYFNLTGNVKRDVLDHRMAIDSDSIVEIDSVMIPTGKIRKVKGTALDFTTPKRIGDNIDSNDDQVKLAKGYDHCFVLRGQIGVLHPAVSLYEPTNGRMLSVATSAPGVQIYSGNFLNGSITGKGGVVYNRRFGICFETGLYPDSPNRPEFPSPELWPEKVYRVETVFSFGVR